MGLDPVTVGLIVSAVGTAVSYDQNKRSVAAQKEGREINSAQQRAADIRQRRNQARQARVRRAQILQSSANTGTGGSSGELGAMSSLQSKQDAGSSFLFGSEVAASAISSSNQRAADSQFRSNLTTNITRLGVGVANNAGAIKDAFTEPSPTST